jgi:hypothetical protein
MTSFFIPYGCYLKCSASGRTTTYAIFSTCM